MSWRVSCRGGHTRLPVGPPQASMRKQFCAGLDTVEAALGQAAAGSLPGGLDWQPRAGPFFLGDRISMVDLVFAPFLERMVASLLYYKGFQMRGGDYPHLDVRRMPPCELVPLG